MFSKTLGDEFAKMAQYAGGLPFSYSRASTLFRCTLQFEHTYRVQGTPRGTPSANDETRVGSLAHQILECTVSDANATNNLTTLGGNFEGNFNRLVATADNETQKNVLAEVKRPMVAAISELFTLAREGEYIVTQERELKFAKDGMHIPTLKRMSKAKPYGKLGFKGYVDLELRRGDELLIYDYKTEMPSEVRNESVEKQMGLYAFCEFEARPHLKEITTSVVYLKNAEIKEIASYSRNADYESLRSMVVSWMDEYVYALAHYEVKKTKNEYCKYCCFKDYCDSI